VNESILFAVIALGALGVAAAVILYFVAQKFKVIEDPRIDFVAEVLPGANCGGCGYAGCRNFAEAIVGSGSLEGKNCPVGGSDVMAKAGDVMGLKPEISEPKIAVIRCNGSKSHAPQKSQLDGADSCSFSHYLFAGESGCPNGCIGIGDCVKACAFDAIHIDHETGLPHVHDNCVACGACVKACPRGLIELRFKGKKGRRIFISCMNTEKGAPAKKNCEVACIGCGKCMKICPFEAITINNNLAYIDFKKCKLCRKCVAECPTSAIHELNFPAAKTAGTTEVAEAIA
jgi:electron transport complex protein RnfB